MNSLRGAMPVVFVMLAASMRADDKDMITYEDQIKPIFRQHCFACHGDDKQKSDLNLQSFATLLKGGSTGVVVVAGRSSQSLLFKAITDPDDEARMPPKKPALPKEQVALIQKWIDSGLRESASGKSLVAERDLSFKPVASGAAKPANPAMPEKLPDVKVPQTLRPLPVLAMDASPWAPLVAVAGQEHVRLMNVDTQTEVGRLAFPEGLPQVIRFSRDGAVLMVAGGRPVESGKVVLFDVKSGKRLSVIGDEVDSVMAADLSPDQQFVALGGSGKVVKVYSTTDGRPKYKIEKHTDWITSVAFSPNGSQLATADRAGGIHLWEVKSGRVLLSLNEHKASVRALDWRSDSKMLASAGEDGLIIWWDVTDGWPAVSKPNAHPPVRPAGAYGKIPNGVLAARFDHEGNLSTAGRDHTIRLWDAKGVERKTFSLSDSQPLCAAISFDAKTVIGGDSNGGVRFWKTEANAK
jgi:mono/diheme cytochrome c family protein